MKNIYRSFVILFLLVIIYPLVSYAGPPSIPGSGATSYSQIVGLFGSGSCTGFLHSDGTCSTPPGGDIAQSGSPANHYWAYFTADKTITGVAITASKPVCSDANGNPAVCAGTEGVWQAAGSYLTSANIAATITNGDTTHAPDGNSVYDALALKQDYSAVLAALAGIAITVDGNNVTFPGGVITTAANGSRIIGTLDNTTTLTFLTAGTYGWYFDNGVPYFNINGTGDKSMYEGGSFGGLIFGDSSPDAAGEIGYDGELKYYDAVGSKTVATVGGALGTPSFTALNMPSSNADPGTTAGQIKHDSTDTGSNSGGTAKWYDGAQVRQFIDTGTNYSLITKYEYMPIRYAEDDDSVTAPAAAAEIGTTSMIARSFAEDADNGVVFFWQIPGDYVSGIKFRVFFATDTNASANETAVFNLAGCAFGSSGAIACSEGTGQESILELTTDEDTGELLVSGWSAAITISGTPATGKIAKLLLTRDVTGGAAEDDMAGHALVTGIEIKYVGKINAFGDY